MFFSKKVEFRTYRRISQNEIKSYVIEGTNKRGCYQYDTYDTLSELENAIERVSKREKVKIENTAPLTAEDICKEYPGVDTTLFLFTAKILESTHSDLFQRTKIPEEDITKQMKKYLKTKKTVKEYLSNLFT